MNLPKELTIIEEDLEGSYENILDCPLARALKRAGVTINADEGCIVAGWGRVFAPMHENDGEYVWEDGTEFNCGTLRTGKLVLKLQRQ